MPRIFLKRNRLIRKSAAFCARRFISFGISVLAIASATMAAAESGRRTEEEVAQTLANPAASVTALTSQLRVQPGAADGRTNGLLRLQPVVPVELPNGWAMLTRSILPIYLNQQPEDAFGLGETSLNAYFIPPPSSAWFFWFRSLCVLADWNTAHACFQKLCCRPICHCRASGRPHNRWFFGNAALDLRGTGGIASAHHNKHLPTLLGLQPWPRAHSNGQYRIDL